VVCAPVPRTSYITARNRFFLPLRQSYFQNMFQTKASGS
jgi:hypothetical protein